MITPAPFKHQGNYDVGELIKMAKLMFPDLGSVVSVAAGYDHTCAIQASGHLRCWGANNLDQSTVPNRFTADAVLHAGYVDAPAGHVRTGNYTFESLCRPGEGTWQVRRVVGAPAYAPLSTAALEVTCGDGRVEEGEVCDDGNTTDDGWCSADCQLETAICGDGHVSPSEVCDDGEANRDTYLNTQTCHTSCQGFAPYCGDGIDPAEEGEDCDVGQASSELCSATCTWL